jgi:hypothetical protein
LILRWDLIESKTRHIRRYGVIYKNNRYKGNGYIQIVRVFEQEVAYFQDV